MEKLNRKSKDITAENIQKLKELFPEAFTEDGTTKDTKIDFEVLKELLGEHVSKEDERYSFTWNGKSKARMLAQTPSTGTLRPCKEESVDWDTTQNIFIEGDNLEVLKLLQKSYHKKVKMIYIDPPYNTGKDFVYKDNFKDNITNYKEITGQVDGNGRNLSNNPETSGRYHTDWLNMMYPRLKLARNLLKDDGVIFISIDDSEVANLRKITDEIFGEENFLTQVVWQRSYAPIALKKFFSENHDHLLIYSRDITLLKTNILPRSPKQDDDYKNPDNDPRGPWKAGNLAVGPAVEAQVYEITTPTGRKVWPPKGYCWRFNKERFEELTKDNRISFGESGNNVPAPKMFLSEVRDGVVPMTVWTYKDVGHNQEATREVRDILEGAFFTSPKPLRYLKRIIHLGSDKSDIILDFFAGSSTTAHATLQLNAGDGGNRKFIMVQLPEATDEKSEACKSGYKTIAEISKERIRRAAAKLKEESVRAIHESPQLESPQLESPQLDLGFKVFKLDSTNIKPWEVDFDLTKSTLEDYISNIKADRHEEDVLYEILLKYGLDLTLPITEHPIAGQKVFNIGMGALIICLSDAISLEVVEGIAKLKDRLNPEIMRVVFKDAGFKDDVVKTNAVQILKQAGIVDVRSL